MSNFNLIGKLPSKANIKIFILVIALILGLNSAKSLRVTKKVKEIYFEVVLGKLELKTTFQNSKSQNIYVKL